MLVNNVDTNINRLQNIVTVAKRTLDVLVNTTPNDVLATPTKGDLTEYNNNLNSIIVNKLRTKFKIK